MHKGITRPYKRKACLVYIQTYGPMEKQRKIIVVLAFEAW